MTAAVDAPRFLEIPIEPLPEVVRVALAQVQGPLPPGKHVSVVGGRETYTWRSLEEVNERIDKAVGIIQQLASFKQPPHIVVFPEYALPIESGAGKLQAAANAANAIIVAGADNIIADAGTSSTQSLVFIPGREPVVAYKSMLSQWEAGYIDPVRDQAIPILTWSNKGQPRWIAVTICKDFLGLVPGPIQAREGAGLLIVPMCSKELGLFRIYADALLRSETGGTASILCNAIGDAGDGHSCVMAVSPGCTAAQPALELPAGEEAIGLVELHLDCLRPPKKTCTETRPPLGQRNVYRARAGDHGVSLTPLTRLDDPGPERAVINPSILGLLDRKMRIVFRNVDNYAEIATKVAGQAFEVLAVLGQHDLVTTHIDSDEYDMIYDINQVVPLTKLEDGQTHRKGKTESSAPHSIPHFEVETFYKALGVPVTEEQQSLSFDGGTNPPSADDLAKIVALGRDWDAEGVTGEERRRFEREGWILGKTKKHPGEIDAIMTIYLNYARDGLTPPLGPFEAQVLPVLIAREEVTSVYGGTGRPLAIHYVLRVTASKRELFSLINDVHRLAGEARLLITTRTYVVMDKLSDLSLEKACLLPVLPVEDRRYRKAKLFRWMTPQEQTQLQYLKVPQQLVILNLHRRASTAIGALARESQAAVPSDETWRRLAVGYATGDVSLLKEAHDAFVQVVEDCVTDQLQRHVSDDDLQNWCAALNIPRGKHLYKLTLREKLCVLFHAVRTERIAIASRELSEEILSTVDVRNCFAHGKKRLEAVSLEMVTDAFEKYAEFLRAWQVPPIERNGDN